MVKIIAEAGVNHNGDLRIARELITLAKRAGVDAVKFQTFETSRLATKTAPLASYQEEKLEKFKSQYEMLKSLELSKTDHIELKSYCEEIGIEFMSTPFDEYSLEFLMSIGCKTIKISSGDLTNVFLLEAAAKENLATILSTGMSEEVEIYEAIECLYHNGLSSSQLTLLHCTTEYPCPYEDVNLRAILEMRTKFNVDTGYSDHTEGIAVAIAAAALGASIVEKHFTFSKNAEGPDHKASLEPDELNQLVSSIRVIEKALGDGKKRPMPSEIPNLAVARKSLVASRSIEQGEKLSRINLTAKRPGGGLSPMRLSSLIGKTADRRYAEDEQLEDI